MEKGFRVFRAVQELDAKLGRTWLRKEACLSGQQPNWKRREPLWAGSASNVVVVELAIQGLLGSSVDCRSKSDGNLEFSSVVKYALTPLILSEIPGWSQWLRHEAALNPSLNREEWRGLDKLLLEDSNGIPLRCHH